MLTKHQIEDYNENGFIVIEELLSKNEIRQTRHIIDQFIEKSRDIRESDNIFDLEDDHSRNNPRLTRVKQPHLINNHFFNLIKNSIKSIQQKSEKNPNFIKKISIEILQNNDHIKFILVDNGIGFNQIKGKIKNILNPYFTTKKNGTGLGLSIVSKIINDHNGKIEFIALDEGAKIKIEFIK